MKCMRLEHDILDTLSSSRCFTLVTALEPLKKVDHSLNKYKANFNFCRNNVGADIQYRRNSCFPNFHLQQSFYDVIE